MREISFSYNWNHKLDCDAFTTIRIWQPEKYVMGEAYAIVINSELLSFAKIVEVKKFLLKDLNDWIALIDTGYKKEECEQIIRRMYKRVDFNTTYLSLILLQKIK